MPNELHENVLLNPAMVERAIVQTWKAGFTYMAVPRPLLDDWAKWVVSHGTDLPWWELCIDGRWTPDGDEKDLDNCPIDGDGNVMVCLQVTGHWTILREDGSHGPWCYQRLCFVTERAEMRAKPE